jgi:hypothetical protein
MKITLCAISYTVDHVDNQFIFTERLLNNSSFIIEWKGNNWYLVEFDRINEEVNIMVKHIDAAIEWLEENYEAEFNNGTSVIKKR